MPITRNINAIVVHINGIEASWGTITQLRRELTQELGSAGSALFSTSQMLERDIVNPPRS